MKDLHETEGTCLSIHRVSTGLGEGEEEVRWTVKCPDAHHVVDLETCEGCPAMDVVRWVAREACDAV